MLDAQAGNKLSWSMSRISTGKRRLRFWLASGSLLTAGLATATFAGSLSLLFEGGISHFHSGWGQLNPVSSALAACSTLPLVVSRRYPFTVLVMTATASIVLAGLGYPADPMLGPTVALYLLAASRTDRLPWGWRTTAVVVLLLVAYVVATGLAMQAFPRVELEHAVLGWAVAWFAGERTRLRREQLAELKDRMERLQREAERDRLLAAAEERARIARDLHDSAGHAITVIAVQAGAARLRHSQDPGGAMHALQTIEDLARSTAADIDDIVRVLRDERIQDEDLRAPIGLAALDTLIASHRAAGLDVAIEVNGEARPLGRAADQSAYRILQECLTNAARHGTGSARVEMSFGEPALLLTVTNPVDGHISRSTGGHGVIGMRERARSVGGTLECGCTDAIFRVTARIPYGVAAG
jgi:signal transduction histidine kinase